MWLDPEFHTDRLRIRVAQAGDGAALYRCITSAAEQLTPWMSWMNPLPTEAGCEDFCRRVHADYLYGKSLQCLLWSRRDGSLAGFIGLMNIEWTLRHVEIGGWIHPKYAGQSKEALEALVNYSFTKLKAKRVYMTIDDRNLAANTLARRAGFKLEGLLRNQELDAQKAWCNICMWALVDSDVRGQPGGTVEPGTGAARSVTSVAVTAPLRA
ncbi:GNAT family N-acetyltransferase [Ideonella sp.]|uniref:GNAT family N-acetyltransferase n=1 Tax=Ideonella sp. TaxID=1929293 RepID=UPI0037BE681A